MWRKGGRVSRTKVITEIKVWDFSLFLYFFIIKKKINIYNYPLNNSGFNCAGPLMKQIFPNSKYQSTTWFSVPLVESVGTRALDTVEPRIWKKQAYYMEGQPCFLAWKIPWSEEHGRLQLRGSQRVRHDWATNTSNTGLCRKLVSLTLQAVQVWKVIWI